MIPRVAIILVNWNGRADTLECLRSLRADQYQNKRIIVVDNGSADDSVAAIRAEFPDVTLIETGRNLGFTGGNNVGIRRAVEEGADYVFLLNNDTTVEPDALSALVDAASRHPAAGLLTPVIHYHDRPAEVWFAGSRMDLSRGEAVHDNSSPPPRDADVREIPWASGCAMLIPAKLIDELGGFDERFFLNWEDVDLSLRIREAGKQILLVPAARIYHKVGRSFAGTSGAGTYYYVRNHLLLLRLHGGRDYGRGYVNAVLADLRAAARPLRHAQARSLFLALRAVCDDCVGRFGAAMV